MNVLFDLDGTLLVDNIFLPQAEAMCAALDAVLGMGGGAIDAPVDWVGKTDHWVVQDIADLYQRKVPWPEWEKAYQERFHRACPLDLTERVTPGVVAVLGELNGHGVRPRVVSGNMRPVAVRKLQAADLAVHLNLEGSAFASLERVARVDLVREAMEGADPPHVLVGDTHRDVEAGIAAGVSTTIGLATKKHSPAELRAAGADYVVKGTAQLMRVLRHDFLEDW